MVSVIQSPSRRAQRLRPTICFTPSFGAPSNPMYSPLAFDLTTVPPPTKDFTIHKCNNMSALAEAVEGKHDAYHLAVHRFNV